MDEIMTALPPPLDNLFVLMAVIAGIVLLIFAVSHNRASSRRLDAARKEKARVIREAKMAAQSRDSKDEL